MPTAFTHAFTGMAMSGCAGPRISPARVWMLAAVSAALPDVDVVGFRFGVPYGSMFGHRGFTHSLFFATVWALVVVCLGFDGVPYFSRAWWKLVVFFFVVTASHGVLDALTNGGRGIAFFAPFSARRYFFPWTPIRVSPIGAGFFSERGWAVMKNEFVWVWTPFALVWLAGWMLRHFRKRAEVSRPRED